MILVGVYSALQGEGMGFYQLYSGCPDSVQIRYVAKSFIMADIQARYSKFQKDNSFLVRSRVWIIPERATRKT